MNAIDKIQLLDKLDDVQRSTGILGCDLAFLLDITECYITIMRRRAYVSDNMAMRIDLAIRTLNYYQSKEEKPLFKKLRRESTSNHKIRRRVLVNKCKTHYLTTLKSITNKE